MFPTSVAHTELVQLAASRTDNRRSEPTEQARSPWLAPLKARPHHLYCMRLRPCISRQLMASVIGFLVCCSTISFHLQFPTLLSCCFAFNMPGQLFVLSMHFSWLHQHKFYICQGCTFCINLSGCSSSLNCICGLFGKDASCAGLIWMLGPGSSTTQCTCQLL